MCRVGFATQRELAKEQKTHQQRLDDIQRLFEEKLELAELKGNVTQLQVSMSERRFNVVMSILNGLGDSVEALIAGTDNSVLIKQAQAEFAAARERFLQQAEVEDLDESEEEEEASDGGRVRVRTSEAQTNLTPAALGLEDPAVGVKIKKGKRKEKKGRKEKALRELEELGQTLIRLREVDQRCAVFARICNFFSPLQFGLLGSC